MSGDDDLSRWIDRCSERQEIPTQAITEHQLYRWFVFTPVKTNGSGANTDVWYATPKHEVRLPHG